jgi:anaphase-promoting complex subunit 2
MKKRFGEQSLHDCDVMLRDIKESDRLNKQIHGEDQSMQRSFSRTEERLGSLLPLDKMKVRIVTKKFWQQVTEDDENETDFKFKENKLFETGVKEFENKYSKAKPNRLLKLRPNLGAVRLTLQFANDVSAQFECTPLQAAIISQFHDPDPHK